MSKKDEYPYELGDKIINQVFGEELEAGFGQLELIDAGNLHYLLGEFYDALQDKK